MFPRADRPHSLTQATDTSNIRLVFAAVKETILQSASGALQLHRMLIAMHRRVAGQRHPVMRHLALFRSWVPCFGGLTASASFPLS